ncbi:MAG TPA: YncE family protein [Acidimicrobiales bacterium]
MLTISLTMAACGGDDDHDTAATTTTTSTTSTSTTTTTTVAPTTVPPIPMTQKTLQLARTVGGPISPKSVVASGTGLVLAQNMIYNHTVTAYDAAGELVATIPDTVDLAQFGIPGYPPGAVQGGPVEAAFSPDGRKAYVSNYSMYGPGFGNPGSDECSPASGVDSSFVYRIDVANFSIDQVIPVGSVPKYVAASPDGRWVLVSNWCSYDLSIIATATGQEVQRLEIGRYPRGIAVDPTSTTAYVAIMGGRDIVTVDLRTLAVSGAIANVGGSPRHLVMSPDGASLYATLNADGQVAKIDLASGAVVGTVSTGQAPRSMDISADGQSLYVVNYFSNTVSKVQTADLAVLQDVPVNSHPIGITYDRSTGRIWVACYSGTIEIFDEV